MTHAEAIQKLDAAIAQVRRYNSPVTSEKDAEQNGEYIKQIALRVLQEVGAPMSIQHSAKNIFFGEEDRLGMNMSINSTLLGGYAAAVQYTSKTYLQGVQNTIDILQAERDRHKRLMDDEAQKLAIEEQKRGNRIQKKALYVSIVAIIIALVSLLVAICK